MATNERGLNYGSLFFRIRLVRGAEGVLRTQAMPRTCEREVCGLSCISYQVSIERDLSIGSPRIMMKML